MIAWGTTLAGPPLQFAKGPQAQRRFPQIAAYDGQEIGRGRVVVDSTWHHWFDMNLAGLEQQARDTGNRNTIDKILRYFTNVGVYLASPHWRSGQFLGWLKAQQFDYFGQQEVDLRASAIAIGRAAKPHLQRALGPCWVSELVLDHFVDDDIWVWLKDKIGIPDPCLSCPPFELFEDAVLGELVRTVYADMDELSEQLNRNGLIGKSSIVRDIDKRVAAGARRGLDAAADFIARDFDHARKQAGALTRRKKAAVDEVTSRAEPVTAAE